MKLQNKTVLITGANRGIGQALMQEALQQGEKKVYAGIRVALSRPDPRVVPLMLDITDPAQIRRAAEEIASLDMLINNAGIALFDDLSDRTMIQKHLEVNLFGTYDLTMVMLPLLIESRGAVVNILSVASLAALPPIASYSISKAALFSLTQSMRAYLAAKSVKVHAVLTGPVDTDMNRGFDIPKASPESAASAIFTGVAQGEEEIFPDPMSAMISDSWRTGALKAMERQNAAFVQG